MIVVGGSCGGGTVINDHSVRFLAGVSNRLNPVMLLQYPNHLAKCTFKQGVVSIEHAIRIWV